ncbi:uncharacterized protein [Prorops nasuta]|uniref:uncharacterized protein isoform X2 n=1 Tax=Prorops nasuta TaxID=863751 RepID=UPI0034CD8BF2
MASTEATSPVCIQTALMNRTKATNRFYPKDHFTIPSENCKSTQEMGNFRDVTVNLQKFDDIIEKIESLRFICDEERKILEKEAFLRLDLGRKKRDNGMSRNDESNRGTHATALSKIKEEIDRNKEAYCCEENAITCKVNPIDPEVNKNPTGNSVKAVAIRKNVNSPTAKRVAHFSNEDHDNCAAKANDRKDKVESRLDNANHREDAVEEGDCSEEENASVSSEENEGKLIERGPIGSSMHHRTPRNQPYTSNVNFLSLSESKEYRSSCRDGGCRAKVGMGEEEEKEGELIERGPIRPGMHHQTPRNQPYMPIVDWLADSETNEHRSNPRSFDEAAEQILMDRKYSEMMNPALDRLSKSYNGNLPPRDFAAENEGDFQDSANRLLEENGWLDSSERAGLDGNSNDSRAGPIPSIIVNDSPEDSLLKILTQGGFQAGQMLPESSGSNSVPSPLTRADTWSDSPISSCNIGISRPASRSSSRAQSPGSGMNLESPITHSNAAGSPIGSPQIPSVYRVPQGLSSSSSSNQSYGDTPSPSNYQNCLNPQIEEQFSEKFDALTDWRINYNSSGTVINSCETVYPIDSSELELVEEVVLGDLGRRNDFTDDMQVVPKSHMLPMNNENAYLGLEHFESNLGEALPGDDGDGGDGDGDGNGDSPNTNRTNNLNLNNIYYNEYNASEFNKMRLNNYNPEYSLKDITNNSQNTIQLPRANNLSCSNENYIQAMSNPNLKDKLYNNCSMKNAIGKSPLEQLQEGTMIPSQRDNGLCNESCDWPAQQFETSQNIMYDCASAESRQSTSTIEQSHAINSSGANSPSEFNEFQIPEMVSSFRPSRSSPKRISKRTITPWPSLNLPSVPASERLKEGLHPKDVERAMLDLLRKPVEELAKPDIDGDTMLMCLVGNAEELAKKRAYLAPLVERLGTIHGALSMTNNHGEDALYLSAINCPQMAYITGYLAAAMLQKGIDINQRLYHTRGDTLIHSLAAKGDSHDQVLAELLSLKTKQGNGVFDLSKRNYDGRTALHVAVETHDPVVKSIKSISTVRLLLENGADPKIKETKCGNTALHVAVSLSCDPTLVRVLLSKSNADVVNATNYNGNTPLHMAAAVSKNISLDKQKEVCLHLLHAGAQTNIHNRQGKTPLALVTSERKETMKNLFYKKL